MKTCFLRSLPVGFTALTIAAVFALAVSGQSAPAGVAVPAIAQDRVATTQLRVTLDRAGWTYQLGEKVTFRVTAVWDQEALDGLTVKYRVGPEMLPAEEKIAKLPPGGLVIDGGTLNQPGFIRCVVTASVGGKPYKGVATAGFAPEKIAPTQTEPADFDAFWQDSKTALAKIPMDSQLTLIAEASTGKINVYHVNLATLNASGGGTARLYGILCEPKAPGKYPALLRVPGAGVRAYTGDREMAEKGFITLQIGIHGFPVNLPTEVYTSLAAGALEAYNTIQLDQRDRYYYRRVYLGCVRANDFLVSRPNWDGKNLFVSGGSQGGQLSLVTAGLDQRVTGAALFYPAYCDVTGYLHGRAGGWPHLFRPDASGKPSPQATPEKIATTAYYDALNFAKRIKAPGFYSWGYNDEVCPPTSMFAAYNVITAPKRLVLALEMGHAQTPDQGDQANAWLIAQVKP
ncbi:MAG: acetylxylan esterase [Opitutae bacterium]|nr:acetylxylan esterase [Opitutae bacterium]